MSRIDQGWVDAASTAELLAAYAAVLCRLRSKDVVRTNNAPVGDYAEFLVVLALSGVPEPNSAKSYDLRCEEFGRVQVKSRLVSAPPKRGQLVTSAFRSWDFDYACLVQLTEEDYLVRHAALVPVKIAEAASRPNPYVKARVLMMSDSRFASPPCIDITRRLVAVALTV